MARNNERVVMRRGVFGTVQQWYVGRRIEPM